MLPVCGFPPMSNSILCERSGKFGQEAFKTIQERLRLDALTMQEKEEFEASHRMKFIYTKWLKNKKARTDSVGM